MLKIKNITKSFNGKKILDNISFSVKRGEIAVFLGGSGVGKSTLLRVLNNLESIDAGSVSLDDVTLDLSKNSKDHAIGIVFQGFNLFEHLTVEENITVALEHVAKKTKQEALAIAHKLLANYALTEKAKSYPSQLSGGQKQRLAISRTLALNPKIICLDEPTSALDPVLTTSVANNIYALAQQGFIVLVATHDTSLLEKMPCTINLLSNGTIIESAQSESVFANKAAYPKIAAFVNGIADVLL